MYSNLRAEIARKKLTNTAVANAIDVSVSQFSLKMNGHYPFTLNEAFAIKQFLQTKLSIDELFAVEGDE